MSASDPFLVEAQRRGLLTAAQADEVLRLAASFAEVKAEMTVDEIAARKGFVSAAQAADIRRALAKKRVGRYEVIERLGEGAGGIVWKARDTRLDRVVALKVLSQKAQATPEFRERFQREARTATTLNHVNIVRGLDQGEADGYQYFAMEFVQGENAEARLARLGRIPEKEAVTMTLDVVHALIHVKTLHLVHRDIKPGNLILTPDGRTKLGDLGLAKPFLKEHELTAGDGSTAGTAYYMSPEQIKTPDAVDWRSDVYSLGATLYHLLTGRPPFKPDAAGGVIHKHLHEKALNPREHVLEISDGAASVVLRMLQKKPEERYDSLEALAADLECVLAGREPLHVEPPPPPKQQTDERHLRHAVAKRITAETLPREPFPWTTVGMFVMVVGMMVAIGSSIYAVKDAPRTEPKPPQPPPRVFGRPPQPPLPPVQGTTIRDPKTAPFVAPETRVREAFAQFQALRVQPDLEAGRYDAARKTLADFAADEIAKTHGDLARRVVDEERGRIDVIAHERLRETLRNARERARSHDFDRAAALLDEGARVQSAWAEAESAEARAEVEAIRRRFAQDREDQAWRFANLYGDALLAVGEKGVDAARTIVAARDASVGAYGDEVADLLRDLDRMERAGTKPESVYANDLNGSLALLLAHLAHGQLVQAERAVEDVAKFHGDADDARDRIAWVRGALARRADAVLLKAETARAAAKFDEAFALAEEARKILPDHAPARVMLGRVRFEQRRLDEAKRWLGDAARERDAPPAAHLWYGRALIAGKEHLDRAEAEIRQFLDAAARDDPLRAGAEASWKEARALRVEGEAKRRRDAAKAAKLHGEPAKAEGEWGRVVELLPDDVEALFALGQIYFERPSQRVPAYSVLSRVAALSPADSQRKKSAENMLATLKKAGAFVSGDGRDVAADADRYFAREAWDKAIDAYSAALQVSPYLSAARADLVRAYLARFRESGVAGDAAAAAVVADELATRLPDDPAVLALRSSARLAAGDVKHAVDDAGHAVFLDEKSAAARLAYGAALLADARADEAEKTFRAAYDLDPGPDAMLGLVRCHLAKADFAGARDLLDVLRERHGVPRALEREFAELLRRTADGK